MDDFRRQLTEHLDVILEQGVEPMFLMVDLVGAEVLRYARDTDSLPRFRETCMTSLSGAAGNSPVFAYGEFRIIGLLGGYDRLKTFALVDKMRRMLPLLAQSYDCIVTPEFDTIEYDPQAGIAGLINQLAAPRRQVDAA